MKLIHPRGPIVHIAKLTQKTVPMPFDENVCVLKISQCYFLLSASRFVWAVIFLKDIFCSHNLLLRKVNLPVLSYQALEDWDLESCSRNLDLVEASIRSAVQDSSSATRSHGRNMFGAYTRALPQRGQAFMKRMDTSLQEKLNQAQLHYVPGTTYTLNLP